MTEGRLFARFVLTCLCLLSWMYAVGLGIANAVVGDRPQDIHADWVATGIAGAVFFLCWFLRGAIRD